MDLQNISESGIVAAIVSVVGTLATFRTALKYQKESQTDTKNDLLKRIDKLEVKCKEILKEMDDLSLNGQKTHREIEESFRAALYKDGMPRFLPVVVFDSFREDIFREVRDGISAVKADLLAGFREMKDENKDAHKEIFDRLKKAEAIRGL